MAAAKAAGGFLGGLFNNPGALIGLIALGGLLIFRKDITNFFQKGFDSIGENFGKVDVQLGDINLPEIKNPFEGFDITKIFESFTSSLSSIAGQTVQSGSDGTTVTIPGDTTVNPDGTVSGSPPLLNLSEQAEQDAIAALNANKILNETFQDPFFGDSELVRATNELEFRARQELNQDPILTENFNVQTGLFTDDQQFQGGGLSFIGGSVTEIPLERLTIGQIIDRFAEQGLDISASKAVDLKARAIDDFGGFDFGTNTGSGGSNSGFIINNAENVSDSQFEGLTPTEIALRLTGGNISNF